MLVVNTKEIFVLNLHQNRVHFPAERNAFVLDHQHGRRDVTCKPSIKIYTPYSMVLQIIRADILRVCVGARKMRAMSKIPASIICNTIELICSSTTLFPCHFYCFIQCHE